MHWELFHPTRVFNWPDAIQNIFRSITHKWFVVLPIWIYVICGELVVFYFHRITCQLKLLNMAVRNLRTNQKLFLNMQTFIVLRPLKELYLATDLLHRRLSRMLLANCCMSFVIMLTSSYYVIEYIREKYFMVACWDGFDVFDSFLRYFLICHTTDRIREAVTKQCDHTIESTSKSDILVYNYSSYIGFQFCASYETGFVMKCYILMIVLR